MGLRCVVGVQSTTAVWPPGAAPRRSRFAVLRVRSAHRDHKLHQPRADEWLLIECPRDESEPRKYRLSNLLASVPEPPRGSRQTALDHRTRLSGTARNNTTDLGSPNGISFYGIEDDSTQRNRNTCVGGTVQNQTMERWHNQAQFARLQGWPLHREFIRLRAPSFHVRKSRRHSCQTAVLFPSATCSRAERRASRSSHRGRCRNEKFPGELPPENIR
jgi:hypothetical protein